MDKTLLSGQDTPQQVRKHSGVRNPDGCGGAAPLRQLRPRPLIQGHIYIYIYNYYYYSFKRRETAPVGLIASSRAVPSSDAFNLNELGLVDGVPDGHGSPPAASTHSRSLLWLRGLAMYVLPFRRGVSCRVCGSKRACGTLTPRLESRGRSQGRSASSSTPSSPPAGTSLLLNYSQA